MLLHSRVVSGSSVHMLAGSQFVCVPVGAVLRLYGHNELLEPESLSNLT